MYISIDRILIDETIYPRNQVSWRHIESLLDALRVGDVLPPILVGKRDDRYVIIGGRHRYEAHRRRKLPRIAAIVTKELETQWFPLAVKDNATHGHGLSYQEKLSAAMQLTRMKFSSEEIAKIVRIPVSEFEKAISERGVWSDSDAVKPVVLKAPLVEPLQIKMQSKDEQWIKKEVKAIDERQRSLSGQKVIKLADDLTILLTDDYIEADDDDTVEALLKLEQALTQWMKRQKLVNA
jgi:ParB-like chromosome segregation protein Spo0J